MEKILLTFLKKYAIQILVGIFIVSTATYFYLDYKSLKEDKIILIKEKTNLENNLIELKGVINSQEQEKQQLEDYYKLQLELNKVAINITYNKQEELKKDLSTLNKKVIKTKTNNSKENIKNLLDIISEDSKWNIYYLL